MRDARAPTIDVGEGARLVAAGAVLAYPTEAVFGLGCDPERHEAVERVVALKGRVPEKGFILVASRIAQLARWIAPLDAAARARVDAVWPGAVTFVVPAAAGLPDLLTGGRATIAVRVSAHPVVRALCEACGHALVSTSANRSGEPPLADADAVARAFPIGPDGIDGIVAGRVGALARPTAIVDLASGATLRD